jgi:hypothetical protein
MSVKLKTKIEPLEGFSEVGKVTLTLIGSDFELRSTSPLKIAKAIKSGNVLDKYDLKTLTEPGKNGSSRHLVPKVRFSGYYDTVGRFNYSGLMAIHIKNPSNPENVRDSLGSWPEVFMAYILDTGNVMVVFKEQAKSKDQYKLIAEEIKYELFDSYRLHVDPKCTDRDFRTEISYDPDIKVNTEAKSLFSISWRSMSLPKI